MLSACRRRNSLQLESIRRGAGLYPQPGFSRANRTTNSPTSKAVCGRPGRRCGYVQRRATNSRCQRRSVAGETTNDDDDDDHARRGSTRLNAANGARSAGRSCGRATWRSSSRNDTPTPRDPHTRAGPARSRQSQFPALTVVPDHQHRRDRVRHEANPTEQLVREAGYSPSSTTTVELPSAGRTRSSVSRVRAAEEQRMSSGTQPSRRRCLAIRVASRRPRRASGRSVSASVGSAQLDLACRRR